MMTGNARRWYAEYLAHGIYYGRWIDPRPRPPLKPPKLKGLHTGRGLQPAIMRVEAPAHERSYTPAALVLLGRSRYNDAMLEMEYTQRQHWLIYLEPRYNELSRAKLPPPALFVSAGSRVDRGGSTSLESQNAALFILGYATIQPMSRPQKTPTNADG